MALVLSGIASPDEGEIFVNGEQSLVAINTGLNKQLTGLENIQLKGALLGLKKEQIQEIVDGVIEFAEIGDFLYQPVKKYSSGMKSRLGFSINLCLNPDILIIDEALSVGDKGFAKKCLGRMNELKDEGKTIIFISHSLPQVREFCDSAMWLEGGRMKEYGPIDEVCSPYPIDKKFEAFNFHVINVADVNDMNQLRAAFDEARAVKDMPVAIVMKTVKGKGVSFMENQAGWHGKAPNDEQYAQAMEDLEKVGEALCQK